MLVGICQTDLVFEDKRYNLIAAEDYISKCADKGAQLVLFPEMSMTGFSLSPEKVCEEDGSNETVGTMSGYAARYGVSIGFGYVLKKENKYSNHYVIVNDSGDVICDYTKIHPFSMAGEDKVYERGSSVEVCNVAGVSICPLICYDLRFPELFQAASKRAELIVVAANWDARRDSQWRLLLQARALESQSYIIGVNRVGDDGNVCYVGDSMLVDPEGEILDVLEDKPGLAIVSIDTGSVENYRRDFPVKADRREELYGKL